MERTPFVQRVWRLAPARALLVVVGVYVAYLAVVNVLLVTGAFRSVLNRVSHGHVRFDWSSAYSPYPFCFRVQNFVAEGRDPKVEWRLSFDEATAAIDVHDLFVKRVAIRSASARGVAVRIRTKHGPSGPPGNPKDKWAVELVGADATDVREVSIDDVRIDDVGGIAHGGFAFEPMRRLSLERTTYLARRGIVAVRGKPIASGITGAFAIALHDHRLHGGPAVRDLDLSGRARADVGDLHDVAPELTGGGGVLFVDATMSRGRLQDGSSIEAHVARWRFASERDALSASSRLRAGVQGGVLRAKLDSANASIARDGKLLARADTVGVALVLRDLDVWRAPTRWGASLDVPAAKIPRLEALDAYFGKDLLKPGSATLSLRANFEPRLASDVRLELRDVATEGITGWWAQASARELVFSEQGGFAGTLAGRMRDPSVPLAILGVPKLARKLVPGGKYTFQATMRASRKRFAVTKAHVEGHSLDVLAKYHHDEHGDRGAALIEAPAGKAGVRIHDGHADLVPASRGWYDRQP